VIKAETVSVNPAVDNIISYLSERTLLTEDMMFDVRVILHELILNAVIHGNERNSDKKVHIKVGLRDGDQIYIIIEDEGDGSAWRIGRFALNQYNHTETFDAFGLSESGRGLKIVTSLCSSIKRNKKGNKVMVLKELH
jgi:serine/threonine-protein kinase RsbW